ncbi:MAG: aldo/keto reductase [Acidobacteria bacterium]|nr:aldo/keto reductase [Acidobacteriota bacterium]
MKITRKHFIRSLAGIAGAGFCLPKATRADGKKDPLAMKDLGKTGMRVTALGLGASRTLEPALIQAAVERGIRFIDTGRSYMNGKNEEMLGRALQGKRQQVRIQSKIKLPKGLSGTLPGKEVAARLEMQLDQSLKALQTDWLDVMLLHGIEEESILEQNDIQDFFRRAKAAGKIRACGFSTHKNHVALLEKTLRSGFFEVVMLPFNPFGGFRHSIGGWASEWDQDRLIMAMGRAHAVGIAIVAMKTCSAQAYALREGEAPSQAGAVRWVTDKPYIASAVPAMANFSQLEEHLAMHRA